MPIYDYVCGACRHRFEVLHGLNEAGPHQCPECGGPVNRAFAPPTIVFKGSGWAKVDRRSSASTGSRKSTGSRGAASDDGATSTTTGETAGTTGPAPTGGTPAPGAKDA